MMVFMVVLLSGGGVNCGGGVKGGGDAGGVGGDKCKSI